MPTYIQEGRTGTVSRTAWMRRLVERRTLMLVMAAAMETRDTALLQMRQTQAMTCLQMQQPEQQMTLTSDPWNPVMLLLAVTQVLMDCLSTDLRMMLLQLVRQQEDLLFQPAKRTSLFVAEFAVEPAADSTFDPAVDLYDADLRDED